MHHKLHFIVHETSNHKTEDKEVYYISLSPTYKAFITVVSILRISWLNHDKWLGE